MLRTIAILVILAAATSAKVVRILDPEINRKGWEIDQNIRHVVSAADLAQQSDIYALQPEIVNLRGNGLWVFPPNTYTKIQGDYQMTDASSAQAHLLCYKYGNDKFMLRPLSQDGKLNCTLPASEKVEMYELYHEISTHEIFVEAIFGPNSFAICDTVAIVLKDDPPKPISKVCTPKPSS